MWSPVLFVLLVASMRADADADAEPNADADADPFLPYVYPQYNYGNNWAALHFGTPQEIVEVKRIPQEEEATYRPSFGFLPAGVAPSPFLSIRDVQTRPSTLFQHPSLFFAPRPFVIQSSHVRVPDENKRAPVPKPVTAGMVPTFFSQHTAQVPIFVRPPTIPIHVPVAAPSFTIQHSAQVPIFSHPFFQEEEEEFEDDDDVNRVNFIFVPHFPTQIASLANLRDIDDEPVIPAGIVQSTQPSFKPIEFKNSKAHPSLLNTLHATASPSVVEV